MIYSSIAAWDIPLKAFREFVESMAMSGFAKFGGRARLGVSAVRGARRACRCSGHERSDVSVLVRGEGACLAVGAIGESVMSEARAPGETSRTAAWDFVAVLCAGGQVCAAAPHACLCRNSIESCRATGTHVSVNTLLQWC